MSQPVEQELTLILLSLEKGRSSALLTGTEGPSRAAKKSIFQNAHFAHDLNEGIAAATCVNSIARGRQVHVSLPSGTRPGVAYVS